MCPSIDLHAHARMQPTCVFTPNVKEAPRKSRDFPISALAEANGRNFKNSERSAHDNRHI